MECGKQLPFDLQLWFCPQVQLVYVGEIKIQWIPGVDQSVNIQLPMSEDRDGFLRNIWFKNMSVEQF